MSPEKESLPARITTDEITAALSGLALDRFHSLENTNPADSYEHLRELLPHATEYFEQNPELMGVIKDCTEVELDFMYTEVTEATKAAFLAGGSFTVEMLVRIAKVRGITPEDFSDQS